MKQWEVLLKWGDKMLIQADEVGSGQEALFFKREIRPDAVIILPASANMGKEVVAAVPYQAMIYARMIEEEDGSE